MDQACDSRALVIAEARKFVGRAAYRLTAQLEDAPEVVNCMTLVTMCYRVIGIELGSTTLEEQLAKGKVVGLNDLMPGDLIFTGGTQAYFDHPAYGGIGHVGIFTDQGTVIHATNRRGRRGVVEVDLTIYLTEGGFRVVCRPILRTGSQPLLGSKILLSSIP
jgi:cell wall-associated NlpC family hydrolase